MKRIIIPVLLAIAAMAVLNVCGIHNPGKDCEEKTISPAATAETKTVNAKAAIHTVISEAVEMPEIRTEIQRTGGVLAATEKITEPEAIHEEAAEDRMEFEIEEPEVYSPEQGIYDIEPVSASGGGYLGEFRITFYCPNSCCCGSFAGGATASGTMPTAGWTVACGEDVPFGTLLVIDGHTYCCEDRGVPCGCIDIFVDTHEEAVARGLYYTDVYLAH